MTPKADFRPDVQAVRALAVALVLIFHIWPEVLPAGYIGVDIFFVISGYLITGVLFREVNTRGRIAYLRFYLHRFRRLIPAASVVILVSLILSMLLERPDQYQDNALEAIASALYVQNWLLAWRATDYLAAEEGLGPLMHYWSLSVEEQFYLLWPAAMMLGVSLSRGLALSTRHAAVLVIALLSLCSLAASSWYAQQELSNGYFVTYTRLWELGTGALLALVRLPRVPPRAAAALFVASLTLIIGSAFVTYTPDAFPGLVALIPNLACVALLYSGSGLVSGMLSSLLALRPLQVFGDASYSIYLWHWPIIYFLGPCLSTDGRFGLAPGLALLLLGSFVGVLSKLFIEDRYRAGRPAECSITDRTATVQSIGIYLLSLVSGLIILWHAQHTLGEWQHAAGELDHPGALVLSHPELADRDVTTIPPLAMVKRDLPVVYSNGCHTPLSETAASLCELHVGVPSSPVIALVGDSHAANWIPMVRAAAERKDWTLIVATASGCSLGYRVTSAKAKKNDERCYNWTADALAQLRELQPDAIIYARARRRSDYLSADSDDWAPGLVESLSRLLSDLEQISPNVVVIPDTPKLSKDLLQCLAVHSDCAEHISMTVDRADALLAAMDTSGRGTPLPLRDQVCPSNVCSAVIGGVVVWRDLHHLTATYSRTISPVFEARFESAIGADRMRGQPISD